MSLTATVNHAWTRGGETVTNTEQLTVEGTDEREITVGAAVTDKEVVFACDISQLEAILITTDQDVTMETNSSSAPTDTFTLKAGRAFAWRKNAGITLPFSGDITKLYFTNAGASDATVKIRTAFDATP